MLTSSNQYLRPEYLSPLPTTLDAKKSPLALLAQTCSNIGADTPNNKPIIPPIEKPKDKDNKVVQSVTSNKENSSSSNSSPNSEESVSVNRPKPCFKPYELPNKDEKKEEYSRENRTPTSTTPNSSSVSPSVNSGPRTIRSSPSSHHHGSQTKESPSPVAESVSKSDLMSSSSVTSVTNTSRSSDSCNESAKDGSHASSFSLTSSYNKPGMIGLGPLNPLSSASCVGCTGSEIPSTTTYSSGLLGGQNGYSSLKAGAFSAAAAASMSPYVGYARVKTPAGSTTLVPVCRDPYCTNCQYSSLQSATAGAAACPSGCTQCKHDTLPGLSAAAVAGLNPIVPGLSAAAALYPHSMLSAHTMPYICNWIAGDTYCGKRFVTSEELLQHLRTHTNLSGAGSVAETTLPLGLSLPTSVPGLGGCHLHYSSAPTLTSPAGLRRTYPSALDSLSAGRYHPYKPGGIGAAPTVPPLPPLPHPGLNPYYSPYSMYGQRFGAAVHP